MSFVWVALMIGVCPSDGLAISECDCPQCAADVDEENTIYDLTSRRP